MESPAVFLDRDGTIIEEKHFLDDPDGVVLLDGAVEGLRAMAALSFLFVIVSNQSGIGRGFFSAGQATAVDRRLKELLAREGIAIAGSYMCPHSPGANCSCRKPRPGMIHAAVRDLRLDLTRSFVIGDKRCDIDLAAAAGATGILVTTGHGHADIDYARSLPVPVCRDLIEASEVVLRHVGNR
jgi:D-glycero-D-manno-heptose 1,7-bisphosphate phosphatase